MSLTVWVELKWLNRIKTASERMSRAWAPAQLQEVTSEEHDVDVYEFFYKRGGEGGHFHNSHSSPYSLYPAGSKPSMFNLCLDWKAPWQPPGSGVTGKGCFYLLMRSVPGAPFLSASVSPHLPCAVEGGGDQWLWMPAKWHQCHLHSCAPQTPSCTLWEWDGLQGCRAGAVTPTRFCPVGKKTTGSKIAVPQSASSLWNKCSHANRQSPL